MDAEALDCTPKPECLAAVAGDEGGDADEVEADGRRRLLSQGDWKRLGTMVDNGVGPGAGHAAGDEKTNGIEQECSPSTFS